MQTKYYTYGNIIRILTLDDADFSKSKMVDVNTEDETILTQSTVGFHPTTSPTILSKANYILLINNIQTYPDK